MRCQAWILLAVITQGLLSCGQKGPLQLPDTLKPWSSEPQLSLHTSYVYIAHEGDSSPVDLMALFLVTRLLEPEMARHGADQAETTRRLH